MGEISDMLHSLVIDARRLLARLAIGQVKVNVKVKEKKRGKTKTETYIQVIEDDDIGMLPRIP